MIAEKMAKWLRIVRFGYGIPFCCLLTILFGTSLWMFQEIYVIRCSNTTQGKLIYIRDIRPGDWFTFKYIHSVQKTPVYEVFTIDEAGDIVLTETRMMSLGYGLPALTKKNDYTIENDFFVLKNLNRKIGKLFIRVNFVRLMELNFGGSIFDLPRYYGSAGDLIEVSASRRKRIATIINVPRKLWPVKQR